MNYLDTLRNWIAQIVYILLVLVPLAIVLQILFGDQMSFVGQVVPNLIGLLHLFGNNGLVGLIALGIIIWLFAEIGRTSSGGSHTGSPPASQF
jgi:hypothetical protein